jgi:hypothetical protein
MILLTEKVKQFCHAPRAFPVKVVLLFALSFQPLPYNMPLFTWLWNQ